MNGSLRGRLGSLGLVTLVTLLIWIWAAGETRENRRIDASIRFATSDAKRLLVEPRELDGALLSVSGSKRAITAFEALMNAGTLELVAGAHGLPSSPGTWPIQLATALGSLPAVRDAGVSIDGVEPNSIPLRLVPLEARTARPVADLPGIRTQGDVLVEPATISVVLPTGILPAGIEPSVLAVVDPRRLEQLEPGKRVTLEATLQVAPALAGEASRIALEPPTAKVVFTPRSLERTVTVNSVPVQVAGVADDFARYRVDLETPSLGPVVLSGPNDAIARIEGGERVVALVHLTSDDLQKRVASKTVSLWMLPPGVTVQKVAGLDGGQPTVSLVIVPLDEPASPTP